MQKLFEVILKDDGTPDVICHNEQYIDKKSSPKQFDSFTKQLIKVLVRKFFGEKNTGISKIIRVLSMAEICACSEPYAQAEEFWSTMMFDFIPHTEKYADNLKKQFGYNPKKKQRPITFGDTSMFQLFGPFKN